ncbi:MAG: SAM-dependent DNA methyltransferase [Desulfobacula sp.]|jgi:type I restriction enzyme M protein|uniref:type I restriction-modification system subunit M n=2 Tax=Desulfobacula sp. TaxID=2593537 RepID=UPI001D9D8995|nr:SAM-dependent DNA methyltransferase [Desulfobacula sp.]MBT3806322.1 SAM-dependent DNA methyltransferase [Desulfobacula sp.]MBT4024254.1 SAM-dependent DNA methyltransferase [Desulfobacula sp.]MBT4874700.1 SAM-dependent DNA methyltransferase [Desulfobacula sp.]MBT5543457.1 SAM-dependent DNA methyltransferase [Desulfobacula sp.]
MSKTTNNMAAYIWSLADLLRGDFKQSQYGRIILPFTLLRRLEGVLEQSKASVLAKHKEIQKMDLPEEAEEKLLLRATNGLSFFNISQMNLSKLGESDIKDNLESYIQGFSKDAREIFEYFNFSEFIGQLSDANLLYKVVQKVRKTDLSPKAISNHEMGLVFEELIRRFAESSNETAGEHFTPRDIVRLTTSLVFMEDDDALTKPGIIRTIYDPTAGTGGFLSSGMEYVHELNPKAVMRAFGQELNPESYAICKGDMLIKGQEVDNIKLGNTLSGDQLYSDKFDYMLSNPPFGVDWKKIEDVVKDENTLKGYDGRFGPGLPRVSDGSLLFLLHLISKLRDASEGGARIGIILNGSPLFTGGAGSGESEIRRYILEADLLEAIVALPTDMFYNTGIATYVWILSNKKSKERKGKVQLINGVNLYGKMRKSLGSKRKVMDDTDIATITRCFGDFEVIDAQKLDKPMEQKSNRGRQSENPVTEAPKTFGSKIFDYYEFGYRRITIERPLRESFQFSNERIAELRFVPRPLNAVMKWVYEEYGQQWSDDNDCKYYGILSEHEDCIRKTIKSNFPKLKEKQIKTLLDDKLWLTRKQIMLKAKDLQQAIGTDQFDDMNLYNDMIKATGIQLDAKEKKQITVAVSWKNPKAEKVIKKVHKKTNSDPVYGLFDVEGKVMEYKPDSDLRDYENVALDPSKSVNDLNEAYFAREVLPHVPEAWIDAKKKDAKDGEIGIVGYEIPFNRHFYVYQPPRDLAEIDADLNKVSAEILELLQEVHL